MRLLTVILVAAVMTFAGCDLDLGSASDQYHVTFSVTDGDQGVTYKKGETTNGNVPVFLYYGSPVSGGTLIASKSGVALNTDGTVNIPVGGVDDAGDYFFLKVSGNIIESSGSRVRYQGVDYPGLMAEGTVAIVTPALGDTAVTASAFSIILNDGSTGISISGTFSALGIDLDAGGDVTK